MLDFLHKLGQALAIPVDSPYEFWTPFNNPTKISMIDELRFAFTAVLPQCLTYGLTGILCHCWV
jgi:hypothetical protein